MKGLRSLIHVSPEHGNNPVARYPTLRQMSADAVLMAEWRIVVAEFFASAQ